MTSHTFSARSWSSLWRRAPAAVSIAALLLILPLAGTIAGCRTQDHFFDVTGHLYVPSAASYYDDAHRRATDRWEPDAYLSSIRTNVASPTGARLEPWLTYTFHSPGRRQAFYVLDLVGDDWTSEVVRRPSISTPPSQIQRDDWPLDSVDAWSIALANGGERFLLRHQDPRTSMSLTLTRTSVAGSKGVLVWKVQYVILFGPKLSVMIDPLSGDILEVEGDF